MTLNIREIKQIEERVKEGILDKETADWICVIFSSVTAYKEWRNPKK